jgi:hypothetical protein
MLVLDIESVPDSFVMSQPAERAWVEQAAAKREMTPEGYCQLCPPLAKPYCIGYLTDVAVPSITVLYDASEHGIASESEWTLNATGRKSINCAPVPCSFVPMEDERELLVKFAEVIQANERGPLVTYNGRSYDLLVLWHRMKRANLKSPQIEGALRERRWDHNYSDDLQDVVTFDGVGGRWPMAAYALGHRLHFSKGEIDGANLLPALQAGKVDEVLAYNCGDVECTRQLWVHLHGQGGR